MKSSIFTSFLLTLLVSYAQCSQFNRVCYFTSWSKYRVSPYSRFDIKDIDPTLCTHVIYAFGQIDVETKLLTAHEPLVEEQTPKQLGRFREFNNLKQQNSKMSTLLSIGGQFDNGNGFTTVSENDIIVKRFASRAAVWLRSRGFDGLDIDWEYPTKDTKRAFVRLLRALREAFDAQQPRLLLTVAGAAGKQYIDSGYDVPGIARYVDFVNLMSYDYNGYVRTISAFNSPLYSRKDPHFNPELSMNWTVHYYNIRGLPFSKMNIGVTAMGLQYVLKNTNDTFVGAGVTADARRGDLYNETGRLAYPEVCLLLASVNTKTDYDTEQEQPFLWKGDSWVGYENPHSAKIKVEYMLKTGAAGFMFWSYDQDDFSGKLCDQGKYPLLKAMKAVLVKSEDPQITDNVNPDITYLTLRNSAPATSGLQMALFATTVCLVVVNWFRL